MAEIEKSLVQFNEWGFFLPLINPILAQSLELSAKRRDESLKALNSKQWNEVAFETKLIHAG